MPDYFIVTITNPSGSFEVDLEIPSRITCSGFRGKLLEILKIINPREFGNWSDCRVLFKNRVLSDDETLARAGSFDGSRLVVTNSTQP